MSRAIDEWIGKTDGYDPQPGRGRDAMSASIRDILAEAKKALEYSSSSLESIESYDDEDRDTDGGSKACKACVKINNRAIAKIDAFLKTEGETP